MSLLKAALEAHAEDMLAGDYPSLPPVALWTEELHSEFLEMEIDGRRYVFAVRAYDDAGLIGEGTHERFAVKSARFMEKAEAKKQ